MQIELRTQVIEPERKTFTNLAKRFGDRPASRYEEGSIDVQSVANFHYRPLWSENHEIYDVDYTAFKLTDPYSFTDPRQLYYAPYVQSRAAMNEAFVKTIDYVDSKDLLQKLPAGWDAVVGELLVPLRHWESGAQLVSIEGSRWAYGTTLDQCCLYAAFDRIGEENAFAVLARATTALSLPPSSAGSMLPSCRACVASSRRPSPAPPVRISRPSCSRST